MKREQFVIEANTIGELRSGGLCSGQHQYRQNLISLTGPESVVSQ